MSAAGLDITKLKRLVIEKWNSAPELWPVKVISLARLADLEKKGKVDSVGGYFTCLRAVRGRTPEQMEDILGFARGYFSSGVSIWKLKSLPFLDQFELRGYTQLPGGNPFDGIVIRREGQRPSFLTQQGTGPTYIPGLGVEQWELKPGLLLPAVEIERVAAGQKFTNWR